MAKDNDSEDSDQAWEPHVVPDSQTVSFSGEKPDSDRTWPPARNSEPK